VEVQGAHHHNLTRAAAVVVVRVDISIRRNISHLAIIPRLLVVVVVYGVVVQIQYSAALPLSVVVVVDIVESALKLVLMVVLVVVVFAMAVAQVVARVQRDKDTRAAQQATHRRWVLVAVVRAKLVMIQLEAIRATVAMVLRQIFLVL
jgi:flagellar biosynthesis protein FliQ